MKVFVVVNVDYEQTCVALVASSREAAIAAVKQQYARPELAGVIEFEESEHGVNVTSRRRIEGVCCEGTLATYGIEEHEIVGGKHDALIPTMTPGPPCSSCPDETCKSVEPMVAEGIGWRCPACGLLLMPDGLGGFFAASFSCI